ncbi:hypothetical protein ACFWYW_11525 [Nonomuraea sp. NPDC059023]|uniref:hypothetical protein n=1 Tax=unclassified Nonomuraea TaxID=2593643 RepID=UPI0036CBF23A
MSTPDPSAPNYGTVVSGGTFTGSNIGGQGSIFQPGQERSVPREELERLRSQVVALLALVEAHAAELPQARQARRDLEEVLAEAETEPGERDPARVTAALDRLGTRLAPVTALAAALGPIADLIATFL